MTLHLFVQAGACMGFCSSPGLLGLQDPQGNLPADAVLALLEQVGGYEVDLFHAPRHRSHAERAASQSPPYVGSSWDRFCFS